MSSVLDDVVQKFISTLEEDFKPRSVTVALNKAAHERNNEDVIAHGLEETLDSLDADGDDPFVARRAVGEGRYHTVVREVVDDSDESAMAAFEDESAKDNTVDFVGALRERITTLESRLADMGRDRDALEDKNQEQRALIANLMNRVAEEGDVSALTAQRDAAVRLAEDSSKMADYATSVSKKATLQAQEWQDTANSFRETVDAQKRLITRLLATLEARVEDVETEGGKPESEDPAVDLRWVIPVDDGQPN